jgi:hypothetical protein
MGNLKGRVEGKQIKKLHYLEWKFGPEKWKESR